MGARLMVIVIPKSLKNKVTFTYGSVKIIEGQTLTKDEKEEFTKFKEIVENRFKNRFED